MSVTRVNGQIPLHQFFRSKSVTSWQQVGAGKSVLCLLCRIVFQIPLQRLVVNFNSFAVCYVQIFEETENDGWMEVGNKLATFPSTGKLRGNVCNGFWALFN